METNELTVEDWKQIAAFYQNKFSELEMKVLAIELQSQKAAQAEQASSSEVVED